MWSVIVGDKVKDIRFKKGVMNSYNVFLGDKLLGNVNKSYKTGWDMFAFLNSSGKSIKGFVNRDRAVYHLLELHGYYSDETRDISEYLIFKSNM